MGKLMDICNTKGNKKPSNKEVLAAWLSSKKKTPTTSDKKEAEAK